MAVPDDMYLTCRAQLNVNGQITKCDKDFPHPGFQHGNASQPDITWQGHEDRASGEDFDLVLAEMKAKDEQRRGAT